MVVCICRAVSDQQICEAIQSGAVSLDLLRDRLGVASCCGRCCTMVCQLLDDNTAANTCCCTRATCCCTHADKKTVPS